MSLGGNHKDRVGRIRAQCDGLMGMCVAVAHFSLTPRSSLRFDTLMYFVQCLFLVFAAVYIAKESVEHVLLEGHSHSHHHASHDTDVDEPDE